MESTIEEERAGEEQRKMSEAKRWSFTLPSEECTPTALIEEKLKLSFLS
jgi:hypothetical protein